MKSMGHYNIPKNRLRIMDPLGLMKPQLHPGTDERLNNNKNNSSNNNGNNNMKNSSHVNSIKTKYKYVKSMKHD